MREIKFRGKRTDNGGWVYGNLISMESSHKYGNNHKFSNCWIMEKDDLDVDCFVGKGVRVGNQLIQVDTKTVGQYTGQQYSTGVDIYEGDVVQYPDAFMNGSENGDWEEIGSIGVIKWDDEQAQFYVTNRESIDMSNFWEQIDEVIVLGNIHDNPELSEVNP